MISASQIRAARAILSWSQSELAKMADVSLATIRKIELDDVSPRSTTMDLIFLALTSAGIDFIDPDGARRKPCGVHIFEGKVGGKDFFEDLRQAVIKEGANISLVTPTAAAFAKYCGVSDILDIDNLLKLNSTTEINCLMTDETEPTLSTPRFQFRSMSKNYVDPVPFCVYGSKYAIAVPNGEPFSKLVIVESSKMAAAAQRHFISLWEKATPAFMASPSKVLIAV